MRESRLLPLRRDHVAGLLLVLLGLATLVSSYRFTIGTLTEMGPGFFPMMLAVALVVVGGLVALTAAPEAAASSDLVGVASRGWLCVAAAPVLFLALGTWFGMLPAIFACVFVAALGDRTTTLRQAAALSVAMSVAGTLIFHYLLQISLPLLAWPFS